MARTQNIERFIAANYDDQTLAIAYAHCADGKLSFASCCCLIGCATADHPLRGECAFDVRHSHLQKARALPYATEAESEYFALGQNPFKAFLIRKLIKFLPRRWQLLLLISDDDDSLRRLSLLPILEAEIKRRDIVAANVAWLRELKQFHRNAF